ncbi:uncharacterized protein VTP21DRAFT_10659 [Calcarisporiella thermophila]|uniref:uncharacterized protein n=1 Tax=Calcarisporiella thermophila TaxID=911321 RepID=UPI0037424680
MRDTLYPTHTIGLVPHVLIVRPLVLKVMHTHFFVASTQQANAFLLGRWQEESLIIDRFDPGKTTRDGKREPTYLLRDDIVLPVWNGARSKSERDAVRCWTEERVKGKVLMLEAQLGDKCCVGEAAVGEDWEACSLVFTPSTAERASTSKYRRSVHFGKEGTNEDHPGKSLGDEGGCEGEGNTSLAVERIMGKYGYDMDGAMNETLYAPGEGFSLATTEYLRKFQLSN